MTLTCFTELYMWLLIFKMTLTFLISLLHLKSLLIAESIKCHNHRERGARPTKEERLSKAQVSQLFFAVSFMRSHFSPVKKNQFYLWNHQALTLLEETVFWQANSQNNLFQWQKTIKLLLLSETNKSYEYVFTAKLLVK